MRDIVEAEVVLVRAKDRTICGLVSAQDIATQFVTLSEPFLFLEQIENHLRAILEKARLSSSGVKELVNPDDADRIDKVSSVDDLSFGETARAFGREEIWNKLHLLLDRSAFCIRLEKSDRFEIRSCTFTRTESPTMTARSSARPAKCCKVCSGNPSCRKLRARCNCEREQRHPTLKNINRSQ